MGGSREDPVHSWNESEANAKKSLQSREEDNKYEKSPTGANSTRADENSLTDSRWRRRVELLIHRSIFFDDTTQRAPEAELLKNLRAAP